MTKIAICADIHLGVPGMTDEILWACKTMREYCRRMNIDTVFVLGDLFHDRTQLGIDTLVRLCKFLEDTATEYGQQWISFPGNHDMFLRHSWDINSLQPLSKHLTVVENVKLLTVDDARFWVLPFVTYEKSYMRVLEHIEQQHENGDVLFTHIGVRGSILNTCFLLKDWSFVTFENSAFDRVYTGHFHSKQQVGNNVWYPGSLIPFKFDEGDIPHGFYVYDTEERSHKFLDIWKVGKKLFPDEQQPAQYSTVDINKIDDLTVDDIKDNMIRVMVKTEISRERQNQIREHLTKCGARGVRWLDMFKPMDVIIENAASMTHKDLFEAWISYDTKGVKELDVDTLRKINNDITHEGDELYTIEQTE